MTEDDGSIPDFLLVQNHVPLNEEQKKRVTALYRAATRAVQKESTARIAGRPRSWDAACEALQREVDAKAEAKKAERLDQLKELSAEKRRLKGGKRV